MEGKSKSELNLSISDWKLKQETLRNQRNFRQLENRLVILEMERQAKVKSIERKLENHKKMMEVRMDRFRLKQEVHNLSLSSKNTTSPSMKKPAAIAASSAMSAATEPATSEQKAPSSETQTIASSAK